MSEKAVVITIDIAAKATGKRKIVVSGAPAGEMPVVRTGVFADVHTLISQVWMELLQREPQVPKTELSNQANNKSKAKSKTVTKAEKITEASASESDADAASSTDVDAGEDIAATDIVPES